MSQQKTSNSEKTWLQNLYQTPSYSDGCCYKGPDRNVASYAVVLQEGNQMTTLEAEIIPQPASAQLAEIIALTKVLQIAEG